MGKWNTIGENSDKFRLLCNHPDCSLSICNLDKGRISITTIHGNTRHSMLLDNRDMAFIVSQYIKALPKEDREKLLEFYSSFD